LLTFPGNQRKSPWSEIDLFLHELPNFIEWIAILSNLDIPSLQSNLSLFNHLKKKKNFVEVTEFLHIKCVSLFVPIDRFSETFMHRSSTHLSTSVVIEKPPIASKSDFLCSFLLRILRKRMVSPARNTSTSEVRSWASLEYLDTARSWYFKHTCEVTTDYRRVACITVKVKPRLVAGTESGLASSIIRIRRERIQNATE